MQRPDRDKWRVWTVLPLTSSAKRGYWTHGLLTQTFGRLETTISVPPNMEACAMLFYKWVKSPIGRLKLVATEAGLAAITWEDDRRAWKHLRGHMIEHADHPILLQAEAELAAYFAGARRAFSVPLDLRGTEFQEAVWTAMRAIPFGEVRSYGEIARQIGRPAAVRAVGAAVGMNPVAVMAPCHRVLGASGTLTGFAGGLEAKRGLLAVEGIRYRPSLRDGKPDLLAPLAEQLRAAAA